MEKLQPTHAGAGLASAASVCMESAHKEHLQGSDPELELDVLTSSLDHVRHPNTATQQKQRGGGGAPQPLRMRRRLLTRRPPPRPSTSPTPTTSCST